MLSIHSSASTSYHSTGGPGSTHIRRSSQQRTSTSSFNRHAEAGSPLTRARSRQRRPTPSGNPLTGSRAPTELTGQVQASATPTTPVTQSTNSLLWRGSQRQHHRQHHQDGRRPSCKTFLPFGRAQQ